MRSASVAPHEQAFFDKNGFLVARSVFDREETAFFREHYMALRAEGPKPGDLANQDGAAGDPLLQYPRMIHMHLYDQVSRRFLLDRRLSDVAAGLMGNQINAVQTMIYFKPPGARGQAMHQDNFFIAAQPGTSIAAWLAIDRSDEAAGCLRVVPGSHRWPILCTERADYTESFTDVTVPLPEGTVPEPVEVEEGDVMFFHGSLVHGSLRNRTADRFRRSLIAHYVDAYATQVSNYVAYASLRLDGSGAELEGVNEGGPCGVWVDVDGKPIIELFAADPRAGRDYAP